MNNIAYIGRVLYGLSVGECKQILRININVTVLLENRGSVTSVMFDDNHAKMTYKDSRFRRDV